MGLMQSVLSATSLTSTNLMKRAADGADFPPKAGATASH
jgi:hypothetical protein